MNLSSVSLALTRPVSNSGAPAPPAAELSEDDGTTVLYEDDGATPLTEDY
jgi:hypothetical protein